MGCLKLSYYQTYSNRKVLYSDSVLEPKSAQMWLSVDPMSDKYPSMSPYNYCANNPVKLIDPNGMEIDEAATKKDPPKLGHPSRDTFFDPQDDSQKNTAVKPPFVNPQSSQQSSSTAQSGSTTTTTPTAPNSNGQAKNPAHSVTIGGALALYRGLSLDIGPIWDKDGGGLLICFGYCAGFDGSGGVNYSNYKSMESAQGSGEVVAASISYVDGGIMPNVGWTTGLSFSPLPAAVTVRKTYSIILKPDPAEYGDYISKFGHPGR